MKQEEKQETMRMQYTLRAYDGSRVIARCSRNLPMTAPGLDEVEFGGARWRVECAGNPSTGQADAWAVGVNVTIVQGRAPNTSFALEFLFEEWSAEHFVLIPGAVYAGNRFESRALPYPPMLTDPADLGPERAPIIGDIPRLNLGQGPSIIQMTGGEMSLPAFGFQDAGRGRGWLLLTHQRTAVGLNGLRLEESPNRRQATLSLMAPIVREETVYRIGTTQTPSDDTGHDFEAGQSLDLHFEIHEFLAPTPQALFDRLFAAPKDVCGSSLSRPMLPFSAAGAIQEREYNASRWDEENGYFRVGMQDKIWLDWELGWLGGMLATYPLLAEGSERSRERALRNFDFTCRTQTDAGLFWPIYYKNQLIRDNFPTDEALGPWVLIRRMGDLVYFWSKQLLLLEERGQGERIKPQWRQSLRRAVEAIVRIWERYGQLGQFVRLDNGEIAVGGSACGALVPAALTLAARCFDQPQWAGAAQAMAEKYYQEFTRRGLTIGGPGDMLQAPDSESAFGLLESYVVLYEATGEQLWLARAREAAHQAASWCVPYDFEFPADSEFARLDMRTTGSIVANAQNKHSAPGLCTLSGDSLFKLYRATGERAYLDLIRAITRNMAQYLSREDRPILARNGFSDRAEPQPMPPGWMNERINMGDWEGKKNVGEVFYGPCWCEVSLMLAWVELPGLYLHHDTGFCLAFDHVEVALDRQTEERLEYRVSNPTGFDARVKLLVESNETMKKPLGYNGLWSVPHLELAAGQTRTLLIGRKDGAILSQED